MTGAPQWVSYSRWGSLRWWRKPPLRAWWIMPLAVLLLLALSIRRAAKGRHAQQLRLFVHVGSSGSGLYYETPIQPPARAGHCAFFDSAA